MSKRVFALLSLLGAAAWNWLWEFIRSLFYERGSRMVTPYVDSFTLDEFLRWGPTVGLALLGIWLFWRTGPKFERDKLAEVQTRIPDALRIIVGTGANYENTKSYHPNNIVRSLSVGVKNIDEAHYLSNCYFYVDIPDETGTDAKTYRFLDNFTLNPGQERFVPIVYNWEYSVRDERIVDRILFYVPPAPGGYLGVKAPMLPFGAYIVTLRAEATESKECKTICKLWVDEKGKLRLEQM